MAKVDIFSGFLGAGKTTLIKKLIKETYNNEKVVLIENEFGEIGIDGGFLKDAGIEITEMNSGCICCSLVGDFGEALKKVTAEFSPERIIIEPSGVGKLSDVIKAVKDAKDTNLEINGLVAVVDAKKCKMYMKNFGEFFNNQIENASAVILSHTDDMSEDRLAQTAELIREHNSNAVLVTTPWDKLTGEQILSAIEQKNSLKEELENLAHHHEHDGECCCGHHHHGDECCHHDELHHEHSHGQGHEHHHEHGEDCCCGHEHHHEDGGECGCGHEHHHEHGEGCSCGHHHHDADEVFASWGIETARKFSKGKLENILKTFAEGTEYGMILRAKGIVEGEDGKWLHFDYVPSEADIREGTAEVTGRICVIGAELNKAEVEKLFME